MKVASFQGLAEAPDALVTSLREALVASGYDDAYLGRCESVAPNQPDVLRLDLVRWHLRRRDESAAVLARLFAYGDAVSDASLRRVLEPSAIAAWIARGLLEATGDEVRACFRVVPFEGLHVLSDELAADGDPVMGPGRTTQTLVAALPASISGSLLDVGCGAGTVALVAAARGASVMAVDISERAVAMTRFNAAMNGLACETVAGDLTAPAGDRRFAWVVSQPPFVASPDAEGTTFLHGGRRGDELLRRLLSEVPARLSDEGRALVLADLPDVREPWARLVVEALGRDTTLGVLVGYGGSVDADLLAIQLGAFAAPSMGGFGERIVAYRAHLASVGVERTFHALLDVRRTDRAFAAERRWDRFQGLGAADFDAAWHAAHLASSGDDALLTSTLRLGPGVRFCFERDPQRQGTTIRLEGPTGRQELSEGAASLVDAVVASDCVLDGLQEVLPEGASSAMLADACRLVRTLLVAGGLTPLSATE